MIDLFASSAFPRTAALLAISCWLSIAVVNNRRDRPTNWALLGGMLRQDLLRDEPVLGQGLADRRIEDPAFPKRLLSLVIGAQIVIATLLWLSTLFSALHWIGVVERTVAVAVINVAVGAFFALWTTFLCGGLWFGYWIKTWHVQQVHFTLFIVALLLWQLAS